MEALAEPGPLELEAGDVESMQNCWGHHLMVRWERTSYSERWGWGERKRQQGQVRCVRNGRQVGGGSQILFRSFQVQDLGAGVHQSAPCLQWTHPHANIKRASGTTSNPKKTKPRSTKPRYLPFEPLRKNTSLVFPRLISLMSWILRLWTLAGNPKSARVDGEGAVTFPSCVRFG